jgi:hypothetical protein
MTRWASFTSLSTQAFPEPHASTSSVYTKITYASADGIAKLKEILDSFASSSGLHINYEKSTLVLIHISSDHARSLTESLQCKLEGFPQSYLDSNYLCQFQS